MSSVNSTSSVSNRYWGLASGLDVDSIVEGLCSDVQEQIDNVKLEEQKLEWKQTAYRDVISSLNTFQKAYLELGSSTTMASSNTYTSYTATSSNTALLTVKANSQANGQSQSVKVIQSAVSASLTSSKAIRGSITGTVDLSSASTSALTGKSLTMTVDGVTKTMTFTADDVLANSSVEDLINNKLEDAFGTVPQYDSNGNLQYDAKNTLLYTAKVTASIDSSTGYLMLNDAMGYESTSFSVSPVTSGTDALSTLGLSAGSSNRLGTSVALGSLLSGVSGEIYVNINGVAVDLGRSDTKLSDALSAINKSGAGVKATYDSISDTISITSTTSGGSGSVTLSDNAVVAAKSDGSESSTNCSNTTAFFKALNISDTASTNQRDAIISVNGTKYAQSSNNFTINGVTYAINSTVGPDESSADNSGKYTSNVSFVQDTSSLEKSINSFITAYNDLVDKISSYTTTKPDKDYFPLTDAQKEDMSQSEIEKWNDKADDGILYGDSTLHGILDSMRSSLYKSVTLDDGSKISLYDIGITTSNDYTEYGKLEIKDSDLDKFQKAILTRSADISQLFTKSSSIALSFSATTQAEREEQTNRTSQEGLVDRLNDVIKSATGLVNGKYGSLLKIAGTSTYCTYTNSIYKDIQEKEDEIDGLKDRLKDKQDRLYDEFQSLETYMTRANSQSSIISSMLGS